MVSSCAAYGCTKRAIKGTNISFHRFPKNQELCKLWTIAMNRKNFKPSRASKICSEHFKAEDYIIHFGRRTLKPGTVPSVFNFTKNIKRKIIRNYKRIRVLDKKRSPCISKVSPSQALTAKDEKTVNPSTIKPVTEPTLQLDVVDTSIIKSVAKAAKPSLQLDEPESQSPPKPLTEPSTQLNSIRNLILKPVTDHSSEVVTNVSGSKSISISSQLNMSNSSLKLIAIPSSQPNIINGSTLQPVFEDFPQLNLINGTAITPVTDSSQLVMVNGSNSEPIKPLVLYTMNAYSQLSMINDPSQLNLINSSSLPLNTIDASSLMDITDPTIHKRKRSVPSYMGDISEDDLENPNKRKIIWHVAKRTVERQKKRIEYLQTKVCRLTKKVDKLNDLVKHLQGTKIILADSSLTLQFHQQENLLVLDSIDIKS